MSNCGTSRRRVASVLCAGLILCTSCTEDEGGSDATTDSSVPTSETTAPVTTPRSDDVDPADPLGPVDRAEGAAIRLGVIVEGVSEGISSDIDGQAAEATVAWLNEHRGGLAGHPIELRLCTTNGDPGRASDCANSLIADGVVAVAVPNSTQAESIWAVLTAADMPVMFYGASTPDVLADDTTFALTNPTSLLAAVPVAVAEQDGATAVTAVVIDVPAAVDAVANSERAFTDAGLSLEIMPVAPGTADMTPQMQQVVTDNPDGVVTVIGNDTFCIAALNGLRTAGFAGSLAATSGCITDATRTAVPGDFLEGIQIGALTPFADRSNPSVVQYLAVLDAYGAANADREANSGLVTFITVSALVIAAQGVAGEVTPESVLTAIRAMEESVMPGTGGQRFRCGPDTEPPVQEICSSTGVLTTTLDASGNTTSFTMLD